MSKRRALTLYHAGFWIFKPLVTWENVQPQHPVSTVCVIDDVIFSTSTAHEKITGTKEGPKKIHPNQLVAHCYPLRDLIPTWPPWFSMSSEQPQVCIFFGGRRDSFEETWLLYNEWFITLLGTNISHQKSLLKMMFLFPRWDMLVPWRVVNEVILKMISFEWRRTPRHFLKPQELFIQKIWAFWHIGIFEPRNKPPYFPLYWLFNRDPYGWS